MPSQTFSISSFEKNVSLDCVCVLCFLRVCVFSENLQKSLFGTIAKEELPVPMFAFPEAAMSLQQFCEVEIQLTRFSY